MRINTFPRVAVTRRWSAVCALTAFIAACSSGRTETVLTVDVTNLRQQTSAYEGSAYEGIDVVSDVEGADGGVVRPLSVDAGAH